MQACDGGKIVEEESGLVDDFVGFQRIGFGQAAIDAEEDGNFGMFDFPGQATLQRCGVPMMEQFDMKKGSVAMLE